jgi:PAS domain S-box-containing protein
MVTQGGSSLALLVVDGDPSFAEAVADGVATTDREVTAETVTTAADAVERCADSDVDGVVLGTGVDAPADAVERVTSGSDVPVVVLADGDARGAVTAAHEADVADVFPRVASGAQFGAVCDRLATAVGGDDDGMPGEYRAVFENVSDGLVVHDPDTGEILDANERFCEMNGYDREALVGETLDLVTATEEGFDFDAATDRIEAAARGDPQLFEWRGKRHGGETYPVEVHLAVVTVAGDKRVLASVRDITERKRREREFEQIFDGVQDAIIVMDPGTLDILQANDAYLEMVGYDDLAAVQDQGVEGLSLGGEGFTVAEARDIHRRVDETDEAEMVEWRAETSDGESLWLEVKVAPAEIGGERVTVAIHRDVTERKRREREFEQIFDGVNDAIAVFDPETGDFVDVNRTYREMWGYDDLETIREIGIEGLSVTEEGYSGERGHELIREVARTGDVRTVDWRGETASGDRRWTEVTLAPADIGGEQRVLAILRDVTERKRRERIVQRLHESTEQLQTADSREAVCEATVAAAEDILDLSMPACWVPGEEAGDDDPPLRPIAATEAAWSMPGGPGTFAPGSFEYGVYEGDELVVYDPGEHSDETPLERAFLVPLGDHGLLGCGEPDAGAYDEVTLDAARILVRHATSALDRVERARELRASERRFRTIAERVDEVIYMASPDMREVEYVSSGYEDVWGEPVGRLESEPFSFVDGIHPDDREEYRAGMERMRSDLVADEPDERYGFDYRVVRPDDEVR